VIYAKMPPLLRAFRMKNTLTPYATDPIGWTFSVQRWERLTSLHWAYDPAVIAKFIPEGLTVDTFDGKGWIGILPFLANDIRLSYLPPVPWLSRFAETNVRTYVRGPDGKPGVWFFSCDCARLAVVAGAQLVFRLPYVWASMKLVDEGSRITYSSRRFWPGNTSATTDIRIEIGDEIPPSDVTQLQIFLAARWRYYVKTALGMLSCQLEHEPWPFRKVRLLGLQQTLLKVSGLPEPQGEPLVCFSPGVHVHLALPKFVK